MYSVIHCNSIYNILIATDGKQTECPPHLREPVKQILTQPDNGILYSCKKKREALLHVLIQKEFQDIVKVK